MTYATINFKPSQIQFGKDKLAGGQAEDYTLNDPTLQWHEYHNSKHPQVMNDVGISIN